MNAQRIPATDYLTYLGALLMIAVGIAGIVLGEADDSPGLQGLGVLIAIGAVVLTVRTARRGRTKR